MPLAAWESRADPRRRRCYTVRSRNSVVCLLSDGRMGKTQDPVGKMKMLMRRKLAVVHVCDGSPHCVCQERKEGNS